MDTQDRTAPPRVTPGEQHLYGDRAGLIRLLSSASSSIAQARDLAARALEETRTFPVDAEDDSDEWREHARHVEEDFEDVAHMERHVAAACRRIARKAIEAEATWHERHGVVVQSDYVEVAERTTSRVPQPGASLA